MPAAQLRPASPHCSIQPVEKYVSFGNSVLEEDRSLANYGCAYSPAAYQKQDDYGRQREMRSFRTAVLSNGILRAEFLLEFGGRLWSLIHLPTGRELLYVNPVFQPGNLALRNAWFSGGVEWNVGMPAHHPFTCSQPFFGVTNDGERGPVLRMWEFERVRCAPYQVDFYLPDGSPTLLVRCRLTNPHPTQKPAYWFSNMAYPLTDTTRVIVPADFAYSSSYTEAGYALARVGVPIDEEGIDASYPANGPRARDLFYRVDVTRRQPWIAAVEADGCGLFQSSTRVLKARKLFVWGSGTGGRRWQDFLSQPGHPYFEIQAGLGRTQSECVAAAPFEEIEWLEAYGMMDASPEATHSSDWTLAQDAVGARVAELAGDDRLDAELADSAAMSRRAPDEVVLHGSGWGALEAARRRAAGEPALSGDCLAFDLAQTDSGERKWRELLDRGVMIPDSDQTSPGGYMIQSEWKPLLEMLLERADGDNWLSRLHLGLLCYTNGDEAAGIEHWKMSFERRPNPFAARNIGAARARAGDVVESTKWFRSAWELDRSDLRVAIEYLNALMAQELDDEIDAVLESMPPAAARHPRIQVVAAKAAAARGRLDEAEKILCPLVLPDLREGETELTDIWFRIQALKRARAGATEDVATLIARAKQELVPPANLDFRMA